VEVVVSLVNDITNNLPFQLSSFIVHKKKFDNPHHSSGNYQQAKIFHHKALKIWQELAVTITA
jgi:hypothetical protein